MKDIIVKNLFKSFDSNEVLKDFSVVFPAGEISCIMGESGCGKSTLMKIMMHLTPPDKGEVENIPEKISAVFQEDRLCEEFGALTNVRICAAEGIDKKRISEDFAKLGLDGFQKTPAGELSGGMKRRVAVMRAMLADSDAVFMDEPFTGLDIENRRNVIEYIKNNRKNRTVIVVTHSESDSELLGAAQTVKMH